MNPNCHPDLNVEFLGCSKDPVEILYSAYQQSYSHEQASHIWMSIQNREIAYDVMSQTLKKSGFGNQPKSLTQVHFVFVINNISSYCQSILTQQKVGLESGELLSNLTTSADLKHSFITPPSFKKDNRILTRWKELQASLISFYNDCIAKGISHDDARLALPEAVVSKRQISLGFRNMQEFLDESLCHKSYWELKEVAAQIFQYMKFEFPTLAKKLGAKCWENRKLYCDEPYDLYKNCRCSRSRPHKSVLNDLFARESYKAQNNTLQTISFPH